MAAINRVDTPPELALLKEELATMVAADAVAIGTEIIAKLGPAEIIFQAETIGMNRCSRWHRDAYNGRAITTYNGVATEYQDDSNVDFIKIGSNDNRINANCLLDPKQTRQCKAGDVLFMRGTKNQSGGLVHRSPLPGNIFCICNLVFFFTFYLYYLLIIIYHIQ